MDIINDPNKLEPMLVEAIDKLKERESALETRLLPMERRLKEIAEMKSRLVEKWVIENMDTEKYRIAQQSLDKEEARLIALRRETDPNEMAELESTRSLLKFWQRQVNSLAWNQEDPTTEDRVMVRSVDNPHEIILKILGLGYGELSEEMQFPLTQRELFDKIQLRLIVFKDKIEVKAAFPMPDIMPQECTST
jgi:hypothetical protein